MNFIIVSYVCLSTFIVGIIGLDNQTSKIVGGVAVNDIRRYPYQASIRLNGQDHCGGAIISELHVLTAAHCIGDVLVYPYNNVRVHTGTSSTRLEGRSHRIASIVGHPAYDGFQSHRNDIAVVTLADLIVFNRYQKKVNLPSKDVQGGEKAIVTGWGYTSLGSEALPVQLQMAEMTLMTRSKCQPLLNATIHDEHICAFQKNGVGSCMGDSGSPLVANGEVVGITSWGVPCAQGYPDIYTKVYAFKNFIKSVMYRFRSSDNTNATLT